MTEVPGTPESGLMPVICSASTVNGIALLMTPFWSTARYRFRSTATTATTAPSLQLCTMAGAVPSHTCPLPGPSRNRTQ